MVAEVLLRGEEEEGLGAEKGGCRGGPLSPPRRFPGTCSSAAGREEHCTQISLACVGSAHCVGAALGLPPLTARVLFQATLLRLQAALQGNCAGRALCCRRFPGLSPQAQVLGTPQRHRLGWACVLCPSQVGAAQATRCWASTLSQVGGAPSQCDSGGLQLSDPRGLPGGTPR